jgi:hypothetical protein
VPFRRRIVVTVLAAAALLCAGPAVAAVTPIASSPLTVWVGDLGQMQAHREGDTANIFYAPQNQTGDAGFFLAFPTSDEPRLANQVYGFNGSAGPFTSGEATGMQPYVARGAQPPTGAGTAASPFLQVTTYGIPDPTAPTDATKDLVTVQQTTRYIAGSQEFGVGWTVTNHTTTPLKYKALTAADFYFEGSDVGTGIFTQGPPRFVGGTNADTGRSGGFVEVTGGGSPSPPWSHYEALIYGGDPTQVWGKVQAAAASTSPTFADRVEATPQDNAGAVEWDQALTSPLAAGATASYALTVRTALPSALQFDQTNAGAPQGVPITFTVTAVDTAGTPFAGKTLRWSVQGVNPLSAAVTLDSAGSAKLTDPGTNAGADTVVAYLDLNNNGVREANEPQGSALATFVDNVPPSCAVKISGDRPVSSGGQGKPLVITVNCGEGATVTAVSTLTITPAAPRAAGAVVAHSAKAKKKPKKKKKKPKPVVIKLAPVTAAVTANTPTALNVAIPASVTKKYPGATAVATVTATAVDAAGNRATATATSKVKIAAKKAVKKKKKKAKKPGQK